MHAAALVILHDAEEATGSQTSPWLFGITAFAVLVVALIVTMMIKVER